jgi:LCP family protein required for cell wall assembly
MVQIPVITQQPAPIAPVAPQPAVPQPVIAPVQPQLQAQPQTTTQSRSLLDMSLPGETSPSRTAAINKKARSFAFRFAAASIATTMVLVITLGGLFLSQSYLKAHKAFKGTAGTATALKSNVAPELLKGEGDGRVNVLMLGRGGGSHEAPDLTDTIMIASIDPVNKTSTLLSVPRDLWVQVPGGGPMKLNAAWETGEFKYLGKVKPGSTDPKAIQAGFDTIDNVIEDSLGVKIHYNVLLNFDAFKQAIDTVDGVSVNVPTDLIDPTMAWENDNNPVLAKAGAQTFDGKHALTYVRSRETSSDFARAQRQRAVMLALKQKILQKGIISNPVKIAGLLSAFGNNVSTDLSLSNANRLYGIVKNISEANTMSASLAETGNSLVTTQSMNGQSVVVPKAGLFKFTDIQAYLHTQLKDPYIIKEHAKVLILNGTPTPGLASKKADELKAYGYNVVATGNTPTSGWTQTTLVDLTHKNKYTKNYLEKRLAMFANTSLSDQTIQTNGADFVIIIGSDGVLNQQTQTN